MTDWLRPLLMMFYAPARGMAEVRDRASFVRAVLLAFIAQSLYTLFVLWPYLPGGSGVAVFVVWETAKGLLFSSVVFVPVVILVGNLLERRGSFSLALQQEYAAVASTVFYAQAAACLVALPFAALIRAGGVEALSYQQSGMMVEEMARQSGSSLEQVLAGKPFLLQEGFASSVMMPFFVGWLVVAFREAFRLSWLRAMGAVVASGLMMFPLSVLFRPLFDWVVASPFLLLLLLFFLRGYIGDAARGQRARAAFRQNLEAATLNPADASAHYNLGLIHLQRKELGEARARFERAVEIDPDEVDAHYQLGRVARTEGRLADAVRHFEQVVARAPSHAQHEIWREVGATYLAAGQFADARDALERFLSERQSDPEGLYLMGRALAGLGLLAEARERMRACIEAVKTAPAYKYRTEKRWLNEAQQFLRSHA